MRYNKKEVNNVAVTFTNCIILRVNVAAGRRRPDAATASGSYGRDTETWDGGGLVQCTLCLAE